MDGYEEHPDLPIQELIDEDVSAAIRRAERAGYSPVAIATALQRRAVSYLNNVIDDTVDE